MVYCAASPIPTTSQRVEILPGAVNVPPHLRNPPLWKDKPLKIIKYIDDGVIIEKVRMSEQALLELNGVVYRDAHVVKTESRVNSIVEKATAVGMKVNEEKTTLLCVSDSISFEARSHIYAGGERIAASETMKVVGFTFTDKPTANQHAENVSKKLRSRTWALNKLRKDGFSQEDLVRFYQGAIRPVAEYASPAYHSLLPAYASESIERQQTQAMKNIFGWGQSARKMRETAGIETLWRRRENATLKFAKKAQKDTRFTHWFPQRVEGRGSRTRNPRPFLEKVSRTDRNRNAPLNYMIRLLNREAEKEARSSV